MIIHEVTQGSEAWAALRRKKFTASEASAMMGASKKVKRSELLHMKATGTEREFSDWVQINLLDKGHEIEAAARPLAEQYIGEELYPVTAEHDTDSRLLASMDGLTMLSNVGWECKSWNEEKAADVRAGCVPEEDKWQVVQQLMVSGADCWIYTVTDGTEERTVHVKVEPNFDDEMRLLAGWDQFERDLANYQPEAPQVAVVGTAPESLPALLVEVTGMVKASNLDQFKQHAMSVIGTINTDLQDDQDFADAEQAVKWCSTVEERLALVKEQILGQTADIDTVFRTIDDISAQARAKRLDLDKRVKTRKQAIRDEIVLTAKNDFEAYLIELERGFGGKIRMPEVSIDLASAIKGKRTIASLRDSAGTELARAKVEAKLLADKITSNLAVLREQAVGMEMLFADAQQLVQKDTEDLLAVIKARITEHREREEKRLEDERKADQESRQRKEQQAVVDFAAANQLPLMGDGTLADPEKYGTIAIDASAGPDATVMASHPIGAAPMLATVVIRGDKLTIGLGMKAFGGEVIFASAGDYSELIEAQDQ